jgi:hypothetical protein
MVFTVGGLSGEGFVAPGVYEYVEDAAIEDLKEEQFNSEKIVIVEFWISRCSTQK